MNYVILKNIGFKQYRVYVEHPEPEGKILYKGHKLGVNPELISQLIEYRYVANKSNILVLKYDRIIDNKVNILDKNTWEPGTSVNFEKMIWDSWLSLLRALELKNGNFRKILITVVNI